MKIITVCSSLDFFNYTRRATIEAIHAIHQDVDLLFYNSILNVKKEKKAPSHFSCHFYHFWILERLRHLKLLSLAEHLIRRRKWKKFFNKYEIVFFIDPNQYYLLPFLNRKQKLIYLLRDPSVLMDPRNYEKERLIISRADAILGVSSNLCTYYFKKYYGFIPETCHVWPNTVDLNLWNYERWIEYKQRKDRPIVGLAGNLTYVIDIELLVFIAKNMPDLDFQLAGKMELTGKDLMLFTDLISYPNVKYLGSIPFDSFPAIVMNWDIGLVAAKPDHEFAVYLNNNKQYQYLALGKPFVSYRLNADYKEFGEMVFLADNRNDYIQKIKSALQLSQKEEAVQKGIEVARKHSAVVRANEFLKIAKNLM